MIGTFFGLEIGRRGLQAGRQALDVTGHNLTNANTEGYSRQEAVHTAADPYTLPVLNQNLNPGQLGTGVEIDQIRRFRDLYLDNQWRETAGSEGYWETLNDSLKKVEAIFPEPTESGLQNTIAKFFNTWQDLNNTPQDKGVKAAAREAGEELAVMIRQTHEQLMTVKNDLGAQLSDKVGRVNYITTQLVDLNTAIKRVIALGNQPNDLMDKRDLLLDELGGLVPDLRVTPNADGTVAVNGFGTELVAADNTAATEACSILVNYDDNAAQRFNINGVNIDSPVADDINAAAARINAAGITTAKGMISASVTADGFLKLTNSTASNSDIDFSAVTQLGGKWQGRVIDDSGPPLTFTAGSVFTLQGYKEDGTQGTAQTYTINAGVNDTLSTLATAINTDSATTGVTATITGAGTTSARLVLSSAGVGELKVTNGTNSILSTVMGVAPGSNHRYDTKSAATITGSPAANSYTSLGLTGSFTVKSADSSTTGTVTVLATDTLNTIRDKINQANAGVTAMISDNTLVMKSNILGPPGQITLTDTGGGTAFSDLGLVETNATPFCVSEGYAYKVQVEFPCGSTVDISSGYFKGAQPGIETARQNISQYLADLDELANGLKTVVNELHKQGTNQAFFNEKSTGAGDFDLDTRVKQNVDNVNGDMALYIAGKRTDLTMTLNTTTFEGYYRALTTRIGGDMQAAADRLGTQQALKEQVNSLRVSLTGVNTDEELTKMIQYQYAYQSSARIVTVMDGLLDTLINRTAV